YSETSSENVTYFELTFRGHGLSRRGREEDILSELARKVPNILGQLQAAGGGAVDMVTPADLSKIVRMGYDPAAQRWLDAAEFAGDPAHVEWDQAGPVADQAGWDHYRHDSGISVTWEMTTPPRSAINELALTGLLAPDADFTRKRVALIYRPHSPEESAKVSEDDSQTANFLAGNTKKRPTASAKAQIRATEQAREEVASGAALVRFSIMVTATVTDPEDVIQAVSTVESRAGAVPLRLRRCYGSQAAAFAATLPVGFVPWEHTTIPTTMRSYL
ncbi:SCO6880 family protein, partial [Solicola sp. PLA-1-18]|uniref:SCO6880 family protein n=1 Tax=Solicola sp. PLA-1-18 TaxID=3380532 RepID=UPI003B7A89D6